MSFVAQLKPTRMCWQVHMSAHINGIEDDEKNCAAVRNEPSHKRRTEGKNEGKRKQRPTHVNKRQENIKGEEGRGRVRTVGIKRGITGEAKRKSWKKKKTHETRGKGTAMEVGVPKPWIRLGTRENERRRKRPQKKGLQDYAYLTDVDETTVPKAPETQICLSVTSRMQNLFNALDQRELVHKDLELY